MRAGKVRKISLPMNSTNGKTGLGVLGYNCGKDTADSCVSWIDACTWGARFAVYWRKSRRACRSVINSDNPALVLDFV